MRAAEGLESDAVGEAEIEEHDVHGRAPQTLEGRIETVDALQLEQVGVDLPQHLDDDAGVARIVLDQQDPDRTPRGGGRAAHGSFTISSQNRPIALTAFRNTAGSIGFVTKAFALSGAPRAMSSCSVRTVSMMIGRST